MRRAIIHWTCEGLCEEGDQAMVVIPAVPLMTIAVLVSHMRRAEHAGSRWC